MIVITNIWQNLAVGKLQDRQQLFVVFAPSTLFMPHILNVNLMEKILSKQFFQSVW